MTKTCLECGSEFTPDPKKEKSYRRVCCSNECAQKIRLRHAVAAIKKAHNEKLQRSGIKFDTIKEVVNRHFLVDIMQPTNRREVVLPRQIAVKVALEKAQMSGRRIGRQFPPAPRGKKLCHRDHTFALRCVQSLQDYIDTTPSIKEDIRLIERKVEIFSRYQMRAQLNNLKNRATA